MDIQALIEKQQEANKLKARILLMPGVNIQYLTLEDVDTLTTQTVIATAEAVIEEVKELVAHSSYSIDPGGHVTNRSEDVVSVCHEIIKDLTSLRAQLKEITK